MNKIIFLLLFLASCVSQRQYKAVQTDFETSQAYREYYVRQSIYMELEVKNLQKRLKALGKANETKKRLNDSLFNSCNQMK